MTQFSVNSSTHLSSPLRINPLIYAPFSFKAPIRAPFGALLEPFKDYGFVHLLIALKKAVNKALNRAFNKELSYNKSALLVMKVPY